MKILNHIKKSIRTKLIVIVSVFIVISFVGFTLFTTIMQKSSVMKAVDTHVESLIDMLSFSIGASLADGNYELVQATFNWAKKDTAVKHIAIYDTDNEQIGEYSSEEFKYNIDDYLKKDGFSRDAEFIYAVKKITYKDEDYGHVIVFYSMQIANDEVAGTRYLAILFSLIALVIGITALSLFARKITKPLNIVADAAKAVSQGDLNTKVDVKSNDEIGELGNSINEMIATIKNRDSEMQSNIDMGQYAVDEIKRTSKIFQVEGDIEVRAETGEITGIYQEMIEEYNSLMDDFVKDMLTILGLIGAYAKGDLTKEAPVLPGKKIVLTEAMNGIRSNLIALIDEGKMLTNAAENGDLSVRGDGSKFEGGYKEIIEGFNKTIENLINPVDEAASVLKKMSRGNLDVEVSGDYKGDHAIIKESLNTTLRSLNQTLGQVNVAIDQVASGAQQVSDSSQALSQGATEQAASLEETTSAIAEINAQTKLNAESADQANRLSESARTNANNGNEQMQQMLVAMTDINVSSNEISKIIKVIDEIAFQTNLLALNAAVEAARAGVHGKGFAVVAEEVRNLAQRSAKAAKETTQLIENSVIKVDKGAKIANETATALAGIVESINKTTDLVSEISMASKEQSRGIEQINQGLRQVDQVTQSNTANAEESASASEELSGQATELKKMIAKFKLGRFDNSSYSAMAVHGNNDSVDSNGWGDKARGNSNRHAAEVIKLEDDEFGEF